jgi:hypothetical protein
MKSKFMNVQVVAISLALMIIDAGPSQAATIVLSGTANSCTYSSISTSSNGDIAVTCASVDTPPTAKPVCTPTASVNPVTSGGTTRLDANCTNLPISSYAWSTIPASGFSATGTSVTVNPTVATTYSVIATNVVSDSIPSQVTVTISVTPPPPPPPSGLLSKAEWNRQFALLNNIPPSRTATEPLYQYFKNLYLAKPSDYKLPGGTLNTL